MIKSLVLLFAITFATAEFPTIWVENESESMERIIKGENATVGEFPFMASIRTKSDSPTLRDHRCGATILTENWLLSAGHCCSSYKNNPTNYYLYVGSNYLSKGGEKHPLEKVVIHEKYNSANSWKNDICLMKVSKPFKFVDRKSVDQVTLPKANSSVASGDKVTVVGWGYTDPVTKPIPDALQKGVDFVALSQNECANVTKRPNLANEVYLCARGAVKGQAAWNGDSGGPLLRQGVQVGIVSFGFRPYGVELPDVYSRVPVFIDWIKEKLGCEASQIKFK